jgi:hypothetical protein
VEWCDDAGKLEATIGKATGDIESLASSIATDDAELKDATAIRDTELADFRAGEKELMETIGVISRAIAIIQREWPRTRPPSRRWTRPTRRTS